MARWFEQSTKMPPDVVNLFQDHQVAGAELLQLTEERLREMGKYAAVAYPASCPLTPTDERPKHLSYMCCVGASRRE